MKGVKEGIMSFTKTRCELCKTLREKGQTRKITVKQLEWMKRKDINVDNDGVICSKCLSRFYREVKTRSTQELTNRTNKEKNNMIVLPFPRAGKSKSNCVICKHKNTGLVMVPAKPRVAIFFNHGVLVPLGVYCCKHHLQNDEFKSEAVILFQNNFKDTLCNGIPEEDLVIF